MRRFIVVVLGVAAVAGLVVAYSSRPAWTTADPWYAPTPPDLRTMQWRELPRERVLQVPPQRIDEAAARLKDKPAVALDTGTAGYLLDRQTVAPPTGKPVLVRGLVLNRGTGAFGVMLSGDQQLIVHHGCMGKHPVPMQKQPLVVYLDEMPSRVYVAVSMVE